MTPTIREFVLAMGSSLPASIVAKATVIAAFGLMGARLARKSRAALRHVLLAATFGVLLLLPVASLIVPPVRIVVPTVRMRNANLSPPAAGGEWILPFTPPDAPPALTLATSRPSRPPLSALLFVGWLAGVTLALIPLIASLWKIRWLRRSGLPWADGRKVADRLSLDAGFRRRVEVVLHEALPGPIASGMLHPAVLFPLDAQTWDTEDLNRALVHELEHVRRGDAVTHCLARAICAVYWFHPLVWMAWRQLILEAELSCDDAVIARSEATAYADQLVALARRLLTAARSPLVAMANRSDLVIRVGAVLDSSQRRGRAGPFVVVLGCVAAVVALTMSPLRTISEPQSARAQGVAPTVASGSPLPSFEVASIKPTKTDRSFIIGLFTYPGGKIVASGSTIKYLMMEAFDVRAFQVEGGPSWINDDRYDITALPPASSISSKSIPPYPKAPPNPEQRQMLQALLVDRFQLKFHRESKEGPVYVLVRGDRNLKLRDPENKDAFPWAGILGGGAIVGDGLAGQNISMPQLAARLSGYLDRPVVDQTGLKGSYDFRYEYSADESTFDVVSCIFASVQGIGLKLKPAKGPVEAIVIDHIERPSEN
jgi:uncharacterized protein (TIGR03435 family)